MLFMPTKCVVYYVIVWLLCLHGPSAYVLEFRIPWFDEVILTTVKWMPVYLIDLFQFSVALFVLISNFG